MSRPSTDVDRALAAEWTARRWPQLTKNEQSLIRFGMFPAAVMAEGEREGLNGHALACAFMDCAKADGGMRA
jgi:hypothetical protein